MPTGSRRPSAPTAGRRLVAPALAALLVTGVALPGVTDAAPLPARTSSPAAVASAWRPLAQADPAATAVETIASAVDARQVPSVQYEEALAHERDRIAFAPGGRVEVGYVPRSDGGWTIDGTAPVALPAGRLDGATIRRQGVVPRPAPVTPARADGSDLEPAEPFVDGTPGARGATAAEPGGTAAGFVPTPKAAVRAGGLRREVFGFLPYWQVNAASLRIDYSRISTIAYFGVGADGAGNLRKRNADGSTTTGWSGWTSARLTSIISAAHRSRTRVVLTVQSFGWTASTMAVQRRLLASPGARANLARQIAAAVRDRGVDGVNLDFEPLAAGYERHFVALIKSVRTELNRIHTGYQITFDTTASIANYPVYAATSKGAADAIFIMGYDFRTSGSNPVGSIAPYRRDGYDINDTLATYLRRVSASRLILGVPYYGRAWSTPNNKVHARNTSSTRSGASTSVTYDTARSFLDAYGRDYDTQEQVAWTAYKRENCTTTYGCYVSWRQLYVDDAQAIRAKYDLVNRTGLRGAGIWALGYDGTRRELWNAIGAKFMAAGS